MSQCKPCRIVLHQRHTERCSPASIASSPVRSGSLLITVLGDSIAPRGGVVTLGSLIRLAEPLGLPDRLVRTSVGRLAQEGWLSSNREGRQSEYFLTEHGRKRFAEATARIYREAPPELGPELDAALPARRRRRRRRFGKSCCGWGSARSGRACSPIRAWSVADTREQLAELEIEGGRHPAEREERGRLRPIAR